MTFSFNPYIGYIYQNDPIFNFNLNEISDRVHILIHTSNTFHCIKGVKHSHWCLSELWPKPIDCSGRRRSQGIDGMYCFRPQGLPISVLITMQPKQKQLTSQSTCWASLIDKRSPAVSHCLKGNYSIGG